MDQAVKISRGEVVGIGKFKMPKTQDFDYEIQLLTFLVIKKSDDTFVSTCVHLHIDGYGKTPKESYRDMAENIAYFLYNNFRKLSNTDAWDNLNDLFKTDSWSTELWDAYHEFQIKLSKNNIPTDDMNKVLRKLKKLYQKVKKIESQEARKLGSEIIKFADDTIVDYIDGQIEVSASEAA